jgi:Leucine-rich repeat (LRR) protein
MGGKFWKQDDDWLDPAVNICSWYGVECNGDGDISGIRLRNNGVIGTVPSNLFSISTLTRLEFNSNSIDFKFQGIASAVNLEHLDLTHTDIINVNGIEGLASTKLKTLKLSSNDIGGDVPSGLFTITTLQELDLSHNKFSGSLSSEIGLLTNLRTLHWYGNNLNGQIPSEIGKLVNLTELALAENSFTGTLPAELDSLTSLETLELHQTTSTSKISGPLLSFRDLVRLNVLELNSNALTGAPPADLLKNTQRRSERVEIKLSDNKLTGTVPGAWAERFDELVLDITGNQIVSIDNSLCQKNDWMEGDVGEYQCDAILCPKGTWNDFGRQTDTSSPCQECTSRTIDVMGSKVCSEQDVNDELDILKELYFATGGDRSWKNDTNWLTGTNACAWFGISCDASGNVQSIDLRNNGLAGPPPKSIFKLSNLRELYLANNEIDFSFDDIGLASKLRILHISETNLDSLNGIGDAKGLVELHATDNDLTGTLPNEIFGLANLKEVYLNFNQFTGRIPANITAMSSLEKLYLFHNRLDGQIPAAIGSLLGIKDLVLSGNAFTGTLPNELNDLTNLEILAIEREGISLNSTENEMEAGVRNGDFMLPGSGIHGPLPSFNKLTKLISLTLGENSLTGTIPYDFLDGIADKSAQIQVSLIANQLTGTIPAALTQFSNLKLFLAGNKISEMAEGLCLQKDWLDGQVGTFGCDAILCPPDTYSQYGRQYDTGSGCIACPDGTSTPYFGTYKCFNETEQQTLLEREILTSLFSATDGFTWQNRDNWVDDGTSFCTWTGITCVSDKEESVTAIHLQDNGLKGEIPTMIFQLKNLAEINFSRDAISFDFTGIGAATKLRYLNLDSTGLTSLSGVEASSSLSSLHASDNDFKGVFPTEVLSLPNLEVLHLTDNPFPSGLPSGLASVGSLKYFSCFNCDLSDTLPSWMTQMTGLEGLELQQNGFSGPLPAEIENLVNLKKLDLSDQNLSPGGGFTGSLPSFAAQSSLRYIYLARNNFTGSIPPNFLNSTDNSGLVMLDLQYNGLTGTIPSELSRISQMNIFLANNKIDAIAPELCSLSWNGGAPAALGCDGILCKKGTFNVLGRAREGTPCDPCSNSDYAKYLGSTKCGPDLDMDILSVLYIDLGGSDWTKSDGWMESNDVCTWYGITCGEEGDSQGRVTGIALGQNNLVGTVISEVFELPYLTLLDLRTNNITLSFDGMLNAQKLETLYLSQTNIKSLKGIAYGVSLKTLHLTDNYLTGTFPEEIFDLVRLENLYLNFNNFSGPLSPKIATLTNLKALYVFHNSLSGSIPSEIAKLPQIEVIALGENKFSGSLPKEMSSMPSLRLLSLQREAGLSVTGEGLDGPLPAFESLPNIEQLYLGGNEFYGTIPTNFLSGITNKRATVQVDLTHNNIEGAIPESLTVFDDLMLFLAGNRIDTVPDSICDKHAWMDNELGVNCDALLCPPGTFNQYGRRVNDDNLCGPCTYQDAAQFYGSTTCEIGNTDGLDERGILFQLYSATGGASWLKRDNWDEDNTDICSWYGVVCETVNGAETITQIELAANGLTGTFPAILFHLPSLKVLNLHNNSVEFSFHGIGYASSLSNLHIDETNTNSLDGIGDAKSLTTLHAERNEFGGLNIPDELFALTNLESLLLSSSGLEGTLSSRIGELKKLKVLNLGSNYFSGEIPSEIGLLGSLEVLSLGENNFFGTLPKTLNQLSSVQYISLDSFSRNTAGISGPLLSFASLPKISELYIGANSLTGMIPADFLAGIEAPDETVNVVLKSNKLSGTLPATLSRFSKLYIDITDNQLEAIDSSLCSMSGWMDGAVGKYQCDAILCPGGEFNSEGRQIRDDEPCQACTGPEASTFLGSTSCASVQKVQERQVLESLFEATGGNEWKKKDGWMDSEVDICDWYGVSCRQNNTVESLLLGSNNLMGTPPPEIFQLPNLRFLWLYSNPIDFKFQGIERAKKLGSLLLDSTGLTSLSGIGFAPALVDVDVRFNSLTGTLPNEIRNLHELQTFYVSNNRLSGTVPPFSTNRGLIELRLGNNRFTGTLPAFATHRDITSLDVSDNQLTGPIPPTLLQSADPTSAITIDLSSNQLTGTVPGELARFSDLTLYLRNNRLEDISPKLCAIASWNGGDVGEFQCDGILCPPDTYAPGIGRATQAGATCIPCDKADYFGSSYCGNRPGSGSSMLTVGWVLALCLLAIPGYLAL